MATPAQTQVTLDATQFIASVDKIGDAINDMNKNLASAGAAFQGFATSTAGIEKQLAAMNVAMNSNVTATKNVESAVKALNAAQQTQITILGQVAAASAKAAASLDLIANASNKTGAGGAKDAQKFTFAWDGIARLLAVTVIRRLFLDMAGAIGASISASAEYQESVGRTIALNQNLGVSTDQLAGQFNNLAMAYGRSLKDTADIGRIAATSGGAQTADQIDAITNSAMRLAEVAGSTGPVAATAITAVTRAFQMTADESQNVSNQLIHLTQAGIGMEAIGGSIGRVSAQAQRLGISFAEMGLLMEELKATGISDSEVMTQLGAVMNSIERPTQRMRELMEGDGIFSPQQLIQANRLHGALQLIQRDISEGNIQANQALQGRRAGGGLAVAESFAARSQNNPLNNVNALDQGANVALGIVDATGRWNDELEKIKTIFTGEIAPQIIKAILEISDRCGGLAKVITDTGRYIAALIEPIALVVGGAVILGQKIERLLELTGVLNQNLRINRETMAAFAEAARQAAERTNTWASAQRQISRTALQEGTQSIANTFTPVNAALTRQAELQRERVTDLAQQIEASSKQVFSAFGSQIESMESVARQAESRIMESLKRIGEFADKTDKDTFNQRLKSLGDVSQTSPFTNAQQQNNAAKLLTAQNNAADQQLALVRDRRRRLQQEIAALQAKGDADSVESARRKFEQLRQLNDQEYDIRQGSARRNAEFTSRATGTDQTYNPFNREREEGARRLNAAEQAFEAENRRRLALQQQALERINQALRQQLQLVQAGQRGISSLPNSLLTPEGRPREGFEGERGGERAIGQINRTIDQQIQRIQQLPASIEAGIAEALRSGSITTAQAEQARRRAPTAQEVAALTAQLESQRIATTALFQNAEARRVSQAQQQAQIGLLQQIARNTDSAVSASVNAQNQQRALLNAAQQQINSIRAQIPSAAGMLSEGTGDAGVRARNLFIQALDEFNRRNLRAVASGDAGDIQSARNQAALVLQHAENLQRLRGVNGPQPGIDDLRTLIERLATATTNRSAAEATLTRLQQEQAQATAEAAARGPRQGVAGAVDQAAGAIGTGITAVETAISSVPTAITSLAEMIRRGATAIGAAIPAGGLAPVGPQTPVPVIINGPQPAAPGDRGNGPIPLPVIINGPLPQPPPIVIPPPIPPPIIINGNMLNGGNFASGGLIGNAFSSLGPDNTMIHARRGEFVVNPDSTRKFYATLVALNRGDRPRGGGYAHGGTVTTNSIGSMTFNVNGSESPQKTAQAVMKIIRREQRRGNA